MSEVPLYGLWPIDACHHRIEDNYFTETCSASEAGSYLRRIDSCITQLKVQGPSTTCNGSKEEEGKKRQR